MKKKKKKRKEKKEITNQNQNQKGSEIFPPSGNKTVGSTSTFLPLSLLSHSENQKNFLF